jgi:hypothetical protein
MGNGCYADDFLQHFYLGWQASRQEGEGEAIGEAGYMFLSNWDDPSKTKRVALVDKSLEPGTKLYTHPASSDVPNAEYIRALQDAFDIIQADANTEENYGSLCRIGSVLGKLKDTPTNADVWIKCSDRLPNLGQRVILKSRGVVQNYMPVFDQGDDDRGMGDHFWDFEDVNKIDNPLVDFEKDCWMPAPPQEQGQ